MKSSRAFTLALAVVLAGGSTPTALFAQLSNSATIAGTARAEAKKPYEDYTVRAREELLGTVRATVTLDAQGNFVLPNLPAGQYHVELVYNKDNKLVCTEGPFNLSPLMIKNDVTINCGRRFPAAIILLTGAGAAGITAGILAAGGPTSASR